MFLETVVIAALVLFTTIVLAAMVSATTRPPTANPGYTVAAIRARIEREDRGRALGSSAVANSR